MPGLVALILTSVVTIGISLPLLAGKVPKNDWYGVRTKRTMNGSEANWYLVNCRAGRALRVAGFLMLAICIGVGFLGKFPAILGIACTALFVGLLVIARFAWK